MEQTQMKFKTDTRIVRGDEMHEFEIVLGDGRVIRILRFEGSQSFLLKLEILGNSQAGPNTSYQSMIDDDLSVIATAEMLHISSGSASLSVHFNASTGDELEVYKINVERLKVWIDAQRRFAANEVKHREEAVS